MKYTKSILMLLFLTFAMVGTASADTTFTYHFSDGFDEADLSLTGEYIGPVPDAYFITSGSLNVTAGGAMGWYPLVSNPTPDPFTSASGAFTADNILYRGSFPELDIYGLLFSNGVMEINLWGDPDGSYGIAGWQVGDDLDSGHPYDPDFLGRATFACTTEPDQPTETPETASVMLLGVGLLGLALGQKRLFKLTA